MCVPVIAWETGIYRKDSQYRTLLFGPLSPGNLTRIRDLGKKSGSTRGKIATISIDDFELLFQDCLVFRPTLFTMLRSSSILFPPVVR
jgi:hypothetical protein